MKGNISRLLVALAALTFALTVSAQPQPPAPLIYEGLAFPELPYASRWLEVQGDKMHYLEVGDPAAKPILLLHGNPTWSYLWRNVMPHLEPLGRVIAPDLIGMGRSDKPDIAYSVTEHREYLWRFIELMDLQNLVIVGHDWGGALGLDYAANHPDNVAGIAFMETLLMPFPGFEQMPADAPGFLRKLREDEQFAQGMALGQNLFVEQILPNGIMRELDAAEMDAYRAPFPTPETRLPTLAFPRQIPVGGEPADSHAIISAYAAWLPQSPMPKLWLYAEPGMMMPPPALLQMAQRFHNLETKSIGAGLHFIQEDQPDAIGAAIADWLTRHDLAS